MVICPEDYHLDRMININILVQRVDFPLHAMSWNSASGLSLATHLSAQVDHVSGAVRCEPYLMAAVIQLMSITGGKFCWTAHM